MSEKIKNLGVKNKKNITTGMLMLSSSALATPIFATTGNTDLDTMLTAMTDGLDVMSSGGVLIIGAVIGFAITFIAARWLFGLFKQWSSKAN